MTISIAKAATIQLLFGSVGMIACSGQESALSPAPETVDADAVSGH